MRLIDADAPCRSLSNWQFSSFATVGYEKEYSLIDGVLIGIGATPTIDAAPVVHGNWITKEYMYGDPDFGLADMWVDRLAESTDYYAECSVCGKNAGYDGEGSLILSDFCPSCGAKMDGGAEE